MEEQDRSKRSNNDIVRKVFLRNNVLKGVRLRYNPLVCHRWSAKTTWSNQASQPDTTWYNQHVSRCTRTQDCNRLTSEIVFPVMKSP